MRLSFHLEIGLDGAPLNAAPVAAAPATGPAFDHPRARLISPAPVVALGAAGVIAGPLFRRGTPPARVTDLDSAEIARIIASRGKALLDDYWGGYIAVLIDREAGVSVLRDPSGMMPCYLRRAGNRVTLASDMTALAGRGTVRIDYGALAGLFAGIDCIGRRTGIEGIDELLPGERLHLSAGAVRIEQAWSPWDHVHPLKSPDFQSAATALRTMIKDCVGAWSTLFDTILLGVSGGLDSSIVAAALGPRAPRLRFLTMVEPGTDGDERRYVDALVKKLGTRLDASLYDIAAVDVMKPALPHFPLPYASHYFQAIAAEHRRIERSEPVSAFFSGNGGDNVFCSLQSAAPLADHMLSGDLVGSLATARDLADLSGSGMFEVARQGWARLRRRRGGHRIRRDLSGLGPLGLAAAMQDADRHPWLTAPPGTLPGTAAHVALLARAQKSIELYPRAEAAPQIAPLLSQPIVELCLSIPSWQWVQGGRDRAVARAAFKGLLPSLILDRTTKGSPSGFIHRVHAAQGEMACKMLAGGKLVDAGLVDPGWLARSTDSAWQDDGRHLRLLSFAAAEAWVRWWTDRDAPG